MAKQTAQDHVANKWQSQDLKAGNVVTEPTILPCKKDHHWEISEYSINSSI